MLFEFPVFIDRLLTIILIISLIFSQKVKTLFVAAIGALILLIVSDQMRLQPWVFQYLLILIVIALTKKISDSDKSLGLIQIIIAGLYFWSGLQKLNFTFFHETLPFLLAPLQNLFPLIEFPTALLGFVIGFLESFIGIGLLFRKTRNMAVLSAVAMHIFISGLLIANNYNSIVWIWNAALIFLVFIAFWQNGISVKAVIKSEWNTAQVIVLMSFLLPFTSFFGLWDMYLSGALYSGNTETAVIRIDQETFEKLPTKAQQTVFQTKTNGMTVLPLFEWAINEFNVPIYPEKRVFKEIFREVCRSADYSGQIELIIRERPSILSGNYEVLKIRCSEIETR